MLEKVFKDRDDYVILKMSDVFPRFFIGDDVDILCRSTSAFADHIIKVLPDCRKSLKGNCIQVDLRYKILIVKFDLLYSTKQYGVDTDDVFSCSRRVSRGGNMYAVPCLDHELKIRLAEYKKHPNKTWHRTFIGKYAPGLLFDLESRLKV